MTEWKSEFLLRKPMSFEWLNENTVIQRKYIEEQSVIQGENTYLSWTCQSRKLTKEEYEAMLDQSYTPFNQKLDKSVDKGNDYNLIIMSAIADLYEKIALLEEKVPK